MEKSWTKQLKNSKCLLKENKALPIRWLTLQLFEGNLYVKNYLSGLIDGEVLTSYIHEIEEKVIQIEGVQSTQQFIYQQRRKFIDDLLEKVIITSNPHKVPLTEKLDKIVTNRILGIPIFLLIMYFMFMLTFDWLGFPLSDLLDAFISGPLTSWIQSLLSFIGASDIYT